MSVDKALVLPAAFCGLRRGELIALHRSDTDLEHGMIRVRGATSELTSGRRVFNRLWHEACADAGVKGLRFHDLRHTGNTLASRTNAGTKEPMARLGHSTARAALIYQHAGYGREREIADAVDAMIVKAFKRRSGRNGHAAGGGTDG